MVRGDAIRYYIGVVESGIKEIRNGLALRCESLSVTLKLEAENIRSDPHYHPSTKLAHEAGDTIDQLSIRLSLLENELRNLKRILEKDINTN